MAIEILSFFSHSVAKIGKLRSSTAPSRHFLRTAIYNSITKMASGSQDTDDELSKSIVRILNPSNTIGLKVTKTILRY